VVDSTTLIDAFYSRPVKIYTTAESFWEQAVYI
jgi:hypothetical protein